MTTRAVGDVRSTDGNVGIYAERVQEAPRTSLCVYWRGRSDDNLANVMRLAKRHRMRDVRHALGSSNRVRAYGRIMRSARSCDSSRLGAIGVILERAYGKPKQEVDVSHGRKASEMSDDEIAERLAGIRAELATAGAAPPRRR